MTADMSSHSETFAEDHSESHDDIVVAINNPPQNGDGQVSTPPILNNSSNNHNNNNRNSNNNSGNNDDDSHHSHSSSVAAAVTPPTSKASLHRTPPIVVGNTAAPPPPLHLNRQTSTSAATTFSAPSRLLVPHHVASKVIKGEIHNLLTVMRSDPRASYWSHNRFVNEDLGLYSTQTTTTQNINNSNTNASGAGALSDDSFYDRELTDRATNMNSPAPAMTYAASGSLMGQTTTTTTAGGLHPLIHSLQHVHRRLALEDTLTMTSGVAGGALFTDQQQQQHHETIFSSHLQDYFRPFCEAVSGRDVSAPVTGAALKALQKFLLYGFVLPETPRAPAIMKMIAESLLSCRFEEDEPGSNSSGSSSSSAAAALSQRRATFLNPTATTGPPPPSYGRGPTGAGPPPHGHYPHHHHNNHYHHPVPHHHHGVVVSPLGLGGSGGSGSSTAEEEQVVLKLLNVSALTVRCSLMGDRLIISPDLIVGLLETCLHVSHRAKRASPLLKSAAADALSQMVLQVFCSNPTTNIISSSPPPSLSNDINNNKNNFNSNNNGGVDGSSAYSNNNDTATSETNDNNIVQARQEILQQLARLLNPALHSPLLTQTSLTLVNIALETVQEPLTAPEISVLQNDMCKYLLLTSTTQDLMILSLTLRVIFNLFYSSVRNHLKVPLEVFLTSVHLRILDWNESQPVVGMGGIGGGSGGAGGGGNFEEKEVVLESLLEFCQEPALMKDIYRNYDCDISCTNLYESMVAALGRAAVPAGYQPPNVPSITGIMPPVVTNHHNNSQLNYSSHHNKNSNSSKLQNSSQHHQQQSSLDQSSQQQQSHNAKGQNQNQTARIISDNNKATADATAARSMMTMNGGGRGFSGGGGSLAAHLEKPGGRAGGSGAGGGNLMNYLGSPGPSRGYGGDDASVTSTNKSIQQQTSQQSGLPGAVAPAAPVTHLNRLALEALLAVLDSITKRTVGVFQNKLSSTGIGSIISVSTGSDDGCFLDDELDNNDQQMPISSGSYSQHQYQLQYQQQQQQESQDQDHHNVVSELELRDRKIKKLAMARVGQAFNDDPMSPAWVDLAIQESLLEGQADQLAQDAANFLYTAPGLDKVKLGLYLSKGPDADYPFQAAVRAAFVALFDFSDMTFAGALRKFLSKFRLPGEAQCIDRLMESFSTELYKQLGENSLFKNSDAVYVLAFSTIMLNTDLHNPTIKKENRMTKSQFIRNNRGINGGEDLPEDFLTELYEQIKETQIQMRREMGEIMIKHENVDFRTAWENILAKGDEVATAAFTPAHVTRRSSQQASVHDKEMFKVLTKWLLPCLTGVFLRSWDDALVVKAVRGMKQLARVASYFGLDMIVNDILLILLPMGRDYIMGCVALDMSSINDNASLVSNARSVETQDEDDDQTNYESELPIPYGILCSSEVKGGESDIYGSASHRGILALDCSFVLLRRYGPGVTTAWPSFIQCLCALRDAQALPAGLADLDDFADSSGNVLPRTEYAKKSQKRLDDYYRSQSDRDIKKQSKTGVTGLFRSLFRKSDPQKEEEDLLSGIDGNDYRRELSTYTRALLGIAEAADVENVIQMGSTTLPAAEQTIRALLDAVAAYPYDEDPVLEQHAVFSLELAARALLANKERASDLFKYFLTTFEDILGRVSDNFLPAPFVLERIVVTVLRSCIHLYDLPDLRPHLRASLHLLMMVLPKSFIKEVSDRMACGLAIILRSSYHFFVTPNDWAFMGDTLDMLAHHSKARVFVFDGIASTVEYALPHLDGMEEEKDEDEDEDDEEEDEGDRPSLSKEACNALSRILIRFVLGFYNNDTSLPIPAMLCLEKVYRHKCELIHEETSNEEPQNESENSDIAAVAPDKDFWQNVAVAFYSACRSIEPNISGHGAECFQRIIITTSVDEIPDDKWIAILYLMVNKQPPLVAVESRGNTFWIIGQLLAHVLPDLSHRPENRDDLVDLITSFANLAEENLRQGRKGHVTPLFEKTLQTVTYLSNHMMTDDWTGEAEFSAWASETLLTELEKVGAAGASLRNQEAVKPAATASANDRGETKI